MAEPNAMATAPIDAVKAVEQVKEVVVNPEKAVEYMDLAIQYGAEWGAKLLAAVAIFYIGRWLAGKLRDLLERMMRRSGMDDIIVGFVGSISYIGLLVFVVVAALGQIGIQTTSFIAILGAAGLAIGLALQGSLSNFAAGFLMIVFRHFNVGDVIEGAGVKGRVDAIQIFTTRLKTDDGKYIIVPNAKLSGDNITVTPKGA
jgi:small conductance mechanosensitive channel